MKAAELVIGKWSGVLTYLGIDANYLTGKHCACPICETGKDKFYFDDLEGRGTYYCNNCGAGNGWTLLKLKYGWGFAEAAKQVEKIVRNVKAHKIKSNGDQEKNRTRLNKLREHFTALNTNDPVSAYLRNRGIADSIINRISNQLGWIPDCEYWEDGKPYKYDAMAAIVCNDGRPVTYQMTYLKNGKKAEITSPRKKLPSVSTTTGGAVKLFNHSGILGVAEGVETALSCTELFDIPTWAALSCNGLKSFVVPDGVNELHVFADNDSNFVGQKAAATLAERLARKGLTVVIHTPEQSGTDWNDILIEGQQKQGVDEMNGLQT
jgi:putative DNA primase/helicase